MQNMANYNEPNHMSHQLGWLHTTRCMHICLTLTQESGSSKPSPKNLKLSQCKQ